MKNCLLQRQWDWKLSGIALALSFFLAVFLVKPIGVSTQFVIADGVIWNSLAGDVVTQSDDSKSGYASPNAYLNKSGGKYAKHVANPINYSFVFVLAMVVGGLLGKLTTAKTNAKDEEDTSTIAHADTAQADAGSYFDRLTLKRFLLTFVGGFLVLVGARLAGGCTSGHMMSGMMQTSLSGYLFAAGAFATAVPTAILLYRKEG
ncbi:MAG: hypothetical protein CR974_00770 [Gammaproteobacteria bacterium]|nr:MAG: hypothetical protein CR974_00770 [Gammaproteobacteria bacterium]